MAETTPDPSPLSPSTDPALTASGSNAAAAPAALTWTFNPWLRRDKPFWRRPYIALLLEVLIAAIAGYSFTYPQVWPDGLAWGGLSLLLLMAFTATLFLPVRYRLDQRGVTVYFLGAPSFRDWSHYRNYYAHDTGVHLTTMPTPSALDPFRGHYLQYSMQPGGGNNKSEVASFLAVHITPPAPSAPSAPA